MNLPNTGAEQMKVAKKLQKKKKIFDFLAHFPCGMHVTPRKVQKESLLLIQQACEADDPPHIFTYELPVGSGKSALGYTFLRALHQKMKVGEMEKGPLFYITANKALVQQMKGMFPEMTAVYGRSEYPCLFYGTEQKLRADEIPCSLLKNCPHRVNQQDGITHTPGFEPCPYLLDKYLAKQGTIVVCSASFYVLTQLIHEWPKPQGLIIDEADQLAEIIRQTLSSTVTDWHLQSCIKLLQRVHLEDEAAQIEEFYRAMINIVRTKSTKISTLLEEAELITLFDILVKIDADSLQRKSSQLISNGVIDTTQHRLGLKELEILVRDLRRYAKSFGYALSTEKHGALNFICAYYEPEAATAGKRIQHQLKISNYYVAPLIQKLLAPYTLCYSGTLGEQEGFFYESGIKGNFCSFPSDFPPENSRLFLPTDVLDLRYDSLRGEMNTTKTLRRIVKTAARFARHEIRSLVIVSSEKERQEFLRLVKHSELRVISYGDGLNARQAAANFKGGQGDVLLGTAAQYGKGLDLPYAGQAHLPGGTAPVIFYTTPGYPDVKSPTTQFEAKRLGNRKWSVWNWRVMNRLRQVRGRGQRSKADKTVTFLMSSHFGNFAGKALPKWQQSSYVSGKTFEQCVKETFQLLGKEENAKVIV